MRDKNREREGEGEGKEEEEEGREREILIGSLRDVPQPDIEPTTKNVP